MVQINFALKEVNCKVVYYGPGLSGKTTNLEVIHSKAPKSNVGELTSIATEGDRTLFFDFLPLNLGSVAGMATKFQIYTVPGQVYYNSTRKLVLQGADGIVFVADSRSGKMDENLESFANLEENLDEYGMDIRTIPLVLQYNKRDLPDVYDVDEMEDKLNKLDVPYFEAVAVTGEGVFPTLKKLSKMVLESLNRQQNSSLVKVAKKQRKEAKEPVAVGAGVGKAPRGGATSSRVRRPGQGPRTRAPRPRQVGSQLVKESITSSSGVKSIERKTPAVRRQAAGARRAGRRPPPRKKSNGLLWAIFGLAVLGAAGAALYFTGMLEQFI